MEETIIIKSEKAKNTFFIVGGCLFVVGFLLGLIFHFDSIVYFIYPWAFSFYYFWPSVILVVLGFICKGTEVVITNRRTYGKTLFGSRVDLPIDSISAVATFWAKGISISTSSGRISFAFIKNRDEIHKVVSNLLISRQEKDIGTPMTKGIDKQSDADELKKYKDLLDSGIITQEEFDAKKKQILGL